MNKNCKVYQYAIADAVNPVTDFMEQFKIVETGRNYCINSVIYSFSINDDNTGKPYPLEINTVIDYRLLLWLAEADGTMNQVSPVSNLATNIIGALPWYPLKFNLPGIYTFQNLPIKEGCIFQFVGYNHDAAITYDIDFSLICEIEFIDNT